VPVRRAGLIEAGLEFNLLSFNPGNFGPMNNSRFVSVGFALWSERAKSGRNVIIPLRSRLPIYSGLRHSVWGRLRVNCPIPPKTEGPTLYPLGPLLHQTTQARKCLFRLN
jgi:hypothetical protein